MGKWLIWQPFPLWSSSHKANKRTSHPLTSKHSSSIPQAFHFALPVKIDHFESRWFENMALPLFKQCPFRITFPFYGTFRMSVSWETLFLLTFNNNSAYYWSIKKTTVDWIISLERRRGSVFFLVLYKELLQTEWLKQEYNRVCGLLAETRRQWPPICCSGWLIQLGNTF